MYSFEFVRHALLVLRREKMQALETAYERLRDQMARCVATVVVNGTRYSYGCVVPNNAASTRVRLRELYGDELTVFNAELGTHFDAWDEVDDSVAHVFKANMAAAAALLQRTAQQPGNAQTQVASLLEEMHIMMEQDREFATCLRECAACEGDTVETHFACLARRNPHVSVVEWYIVLLGFLAHSVAQDSYLPYYSRAARIPDADGVQPILDYLTSRCWWEKNHEADAWAPLLRDAWALSPHTPLRTADDIAALIPPTSCYTLDLFESLVHAHRLGL
jgi:hypothetical protein